MYTPRKINKVLISVIFLFILGVIIGIISTKELNKVDYELVVNKKSYLELFINSFTLNYWYLFIIWLFGLIPLGFVITYFIVFMKGFIEGVIFAICLKSSAIVGIIQYLKFAYLEILILIPLCIYLSYFSIKNVFSSFKTINKNPNSYFKILIKITVIIIVYAILICIKSKSLEV